MVQIRKTFAAYVEFNPDANLYVGIVPGIRGAHSQGATWNELQRNLREVLEFCLEEVQPFDILPRFVGLQQIDELHRL